MFDRGLPDMRGVGISGVTGTGKLELAKAYTIETNYVLVPFANVELLNTPHTKFTTAGVLHEYKVILAQLELAYGIAPKNFVANMTPLDAMTELYSLLTWFNDPNEEESGEIKAMWADACRICSKYLSVIMYLQPLHGSARMEHISALGAGLIHTRLVNESETKMFTVNRNLVELDKRLTALKSFVFDRYEEESPYKLPASLRH